MQRYLYRFVPALVLVLALAVFGSVWGANQPAATTDAPIGAPAEAGFSQVMAAFERDHLEPMALAPMAFTPCVGGFAGSYPCSNVDLMAFMPLASIGGGSGNDIWGWTDPLTSREYALMGRTSGTSFVDITDPVNPVYLGNLPTHTSNSSWRDIKVYANYAFIVSEASGHGMQVFDLTQLRNVTNPPVTFSNSAHYGAFGNAHNLAINEASGYAYAVGTSTCSGGLHMVNIQNPLSPTNAGCFSSDGYTHDTQCVIYAGPDVTYQGREICFNSNEDTLTIVDVNTKAAPVQLSRTGYTGRAYTHQGWLTENQRYFLLDDELDEQNFGHNTRTYIWDVADLNAPVLIGNFTSSAPAIDHNQYVKGNYSYQSNYRAGLRILDITNIASASLSQAGYFDIYPSSDSASFNGSWSNYPYFASGNVVVSGIEQGLFIVRPNLGGPPTPTPTPSPTPTVTPTPTPTPTPAPDSVYASSSTSGVAGGVAFDDEDIVTQFRPTGAWSMYFDGSDVGMSGTDIDAFDLLDDGSMLLSFDSSNFTVPGLGSVQDRDIIKFIPTSTGSTTAGTFEWFFDGSDVGLTTTAEDIDAIDYTDGKLILSTIGSFSVTGASGGDEDLLIFSPTSLGANTSGTWALYFDGSDVGLNTSASEDVNGAWLGSTGHVYLTTLGLFSVTGVSGDAADIFVCIPNSLGANTSCSFTMYWDGSANGFSGEVLDAFALILNSGLEPPRR